MNIEEVRCWRCGEDGSEAEIDQYAGCNSCEIGRASCRERV